MTALTIRPGTAADQATIRHLIREAGINPMNLNWQHFLIAEDEGRTVGIGQVKRHRDGTRELASLAVVPDRRGQGVGSALVRELISRHAGEVLHLSCREQLQGYYERFGFVRLARAELPPYFARLIPMVNAFARLSRIRIIVMRRNPGPWIPLEPV